MAIHITVTRPGELSAKGTFILPLSPNEVMRIIYKALTQDDKARTAAQAEGGREVTA